MNGLSQSFSGSSFSSSAGLCSSQRERVAARRDDEAHRAVLAPERGAERELVLPQREVERGALERPAPVVRATPASPARRRTAAARRAAADSSPSVVRPARLELREPVVILRPCTSRPRLAPRAPSPREHDRRRDARELRRDVDRLPLGGERPRRSARGRAVDPRVPSAGARHGLPRLLDAHEACTRAESRRGSGSRRPARGSGSRPSQAGTAARGRSPRPRSARRAAGRAPSSSSRARRPRRGAAPASA